MWGKVDQPKPVVPVVLEPLNITEAVSSGSVAIHMDPEFLSGSITSPVPKLPYQEESVLAF